MADSLMIWTIYRHPKDFPDGYVTRAWKIINGGMAPGPAHYSASLEDARELCPSGLYRVERSATDDPTVVESWL